MAQKCNWCGSEVEQHYPFCKGCGVSQYAALNIRPYLTEGIDPEKIMIDPVDGSPLRKDSQWIAIFNRENYHLDVKVNPETVIDLTTNDDRFFLKVIGVFRLGLVLVSTNGGFISMTVDWVFFHQELFSLPPQIASATKSKAILDPKCQWCYQPFSPIDLD